MQVTTNSEKGGHQYGNKFDLEVGQGTVPILRSCHKDHIFQISMLSHSYFKKNMLE